MSKDWSSYDSAAGTHIRLGVPGMFAGPARDLAARMNPDEAASWLDVGTGSGVVATMAGTSGVIGLDPSVEMLRGARENGVPRLAAGVVPGLPFRDACFDRVTAGFVLSHVPSYQEALRDMVRVLRPGGRLGVTAWGARGNEYLDLWDAMTEAAVGPEAMRAATAQALPWEDWLAHPENVGAALREAGLVNVTVDLITYPVHFALADFLAVRWNSISARFIRTQLDADGWRRFQEKVEREFRLRFRDSVDFTRDASIGVGDSSHVSPQSATRYKGR